MELIVFEKEAYYKMLGELQQNMKEAIRESRQERQEWISATEAKQLLGIKSKSKLQQLRDQAEIKFSQHGRIIRYSRSSIMEFLNKNVIK